MINLYIIRFFCNAVVAFLDSTVCIVFGCISGSKYILAFLAVGSFIQQFLEVEAISTFQ